MKEKLKTMYENGALTTEALLNGVARGWITTEDAVEIVGEDDALTVTRGAKLAELSKICNETITAGCDVTLSDGTTGHISMTNEDQINLTNAYATVQAGAAGYPYHLDGALCAVYSGEDIGIMAKAATAHKLYHTTYYNHLAVWVNRCESAEEVSAIAYGAELPEDLAESMAEILASAGTE